MNKTITKQQRNDPVVKHMHPEFVRLKMDQTVGQALCWLRANPPQDRIIYFYVVDAEDRLAGVVPTRRLLLSSSDAPLADVMVRNVVSLPATATVLDACEFFIQHRFLAFPVVDEQRRIVGVVDVELYTDELIALGPVTPVQKLLQPLTRFLHIESASGIVLLICAVVAMVIANSKWSAPFTDFWQTPIDLTIGGFGLHKPLLRWLNEGLMTLFFFVVGLEIKRELVAGELNEIRKAMLPVFAALGGMVAPAVVYLAFHWGSPTAVGWGIPMATDIAFVIGFLALLGPRVPHSLKVLLLTLAIVDDIGATLVIALFYTGDISWTALAAGGVGFLVVLACRWLGVRRISVYVVVGAAIWVAFVKSGIHPTIAGVALGLLTPTRVSPGDRVPIDAVTDLFRRFGAHFGENNVDQPDPVSPLDRLEVGLHPWVAFVIMPLFALANAGVAVEWADLTKPVALAVAAGLIVGKPLGIALFCWLSAKFELARLPTEISTKILIGAGCLAGIGFTMSLFVAGLALRGSHLEEAKVGILAGSSVSAVLGFLLLVIFLPRRPASIAK